jgi:hypothetical protein
MKSLCCVQSSLEKHGVDVDEEALENKFSAEMNARVAIDAEQYYRVTIVRPPPGAYMDIST